MTDRERDMRQKVRLECWGFQTNFQGIDVLMRMENDWRVAQKEDDYSFESCPTNFDCLDGFVGLCERVTEDIEPKSFKEKVNQCTECWKLALRGE